MTMIPKELMINEVVYQYVQSYLKEDNLWECAFKDEHGNIAEFTLGQLTACDESLAVAQQELEACIAENEVQRNINNRIVLWKYLDAKTQKKMLAWGRSIKMYLSSFWSSPDDKFYDWQRQMRERTGVVFTRSQYDCL